MGEKEAQLVRTGVGKGEGRATDQTSTPDCAVTDFACAHTLPPSQALLLPRGLAPRWGLWAAGALVLNAACQLTP